MASEGQNKISNKLEGIPPLYYINLDDHTDRKEFMEAQFKQWGIENFLRISANDGRDDKDLSNILKGNYPAQMSSGEVGCVTSHLKAIKHWIDHSDPSEPYLMVMEDDCDLNTVSHWGFNWKQFMSQLPYHWDVIQLAIINPAEVLIKLHLRFVNEFSTACYIITRNHAEKLVKMHCEGDHYRLDQNVKPRAVADDLIYNSGLTFAIPLFLYKVELGSSIHEAHVDAYHKSSHDALWNFWHHGAPTIKDWNALFNYDPYFGTTSPALTAKMEQARKANSA